MSKEKQQTQTKISMRFRLIEVILSGGLPAKQVHVLTRAPILGLQKCPRQERIST